jgi:glycosyltransferase involved in cell wall biosynthesis
MKGRAPNVSICLPVYNGEPHVSEAIRSVLAQTFEDFELIISDNASMDGTQKICLEAAAMDTRVKYFRSEVNRGLAWNFNRAFELASGCYLKWLCHDDVMAPDYISRCVKVLREDSGTVLCFTNTDYIDGNGVLIQRVNLPNPGASEIPTERFNGILWGLCDPVCGLMKMEVLKQTRLHGAYADSDRVLLGEMAMRGRFHLISDYLFFARRHSLRTTFRYNNHWDRTIIFNPSRAGKLNCPWFREVRDFVAAIRRAPISWRERQKCYKYLYWWCSAHRRFLQEDISRALKWITNRIMLSRTVVHSIMMATLSAMTDVGLSERAGYTLRNLL